MSMPNAESNISPVKASDNLLPVWLLNCNAVNKGFDRFIDKNNGLPPSDEWQVSSTIQISRIEELEDEYGRVSDPEIRNHISRTLMSLYHYGSFNGRSIKKDYKKELEWFGKYFKDGTAEAYWLAACWMNYYLSYNEGKKLPKNFDIEEKEVIDSVEILFKSLDMTPSRECEAELILKAGSGGQKDACWIIGQKIRNPQDPGSKSIISALCEQGLNPDLQLAAGYIVDASIAGHALACRVVCDKIRHQEYEDSHYIDSALRERGIEPNLQFAAKLEVEAMLGNDPAACYYIWSKLEDRKFLENVDTVNALKERGLHPGPELRGFIIVKGAILDEDCSCAKVADAILEKDKQKNEHIIAALKSKGFNVNNELAAHFRVRAGIGGQNKSCAMISYAIRNNECSEREFILDALRENGFEPDPKLAAQFTIVSALNNYANTANICQIAIASPDSSKSQDIIAAFKESGIEITNELRMTFLEIAARSPENYKKMEQFLGNQTLLEHLNKPRLDKSEQRLCCKKAIGTLLGMSTTLSKP